MLLRSGREVSLPFRSHLRSRPLQVELGIMSPHMFVISIAMQAALLNRTAHSSVRLHHVSCREANRLALAQNTTRAGGDHAGAALHPVLLNCSARTDAKGTVFTDQLLMSIMWFDYARVAYPTATHVGKMDLDTYVHSANLHHLLSRLPRHRMVYGRSCWVDPCFWNRFHGGEQMCQAKRKLHPCGALTRSKCGFCGAFYVLSSDLAAALYPPVSAVLSAAAIRSYIWKEDEGQESLPRTA